MLRTYLQTPMLRLHPARACELLVVALLGLSALAQAQQLATPAPAEMTQPSLPQHSWPLTVALFAEGTKLFKQWRFDEAEQKFREALTHNAHPLIHVYLSRAIEKQGRLVEAYEALLPVLRPGNEPLPPEDVKVAEVLQKSLESRLAQLEVHCDVPGTEVSLDGEFWFVVPGPKHRMVSVGQHVLVARKSGYFPIAEVVSLIPGKQTRVVIRMTADVAHVDRRWQLWQPWAVAATGVAISLAGQWLRQQAAEDYATLDEALNQCRQTIFCQMVPTRRLASGEWKEQVGTGTVILGGTVLAAGLAGVLLNSPRIWRSEPASGVKSLQIAPMISGNTASIAALLRF